MPVRPSDMKLVDQIVERIHAKISVGKYNPGDRLRQESLAEEFSVSRTPIREALRQLEAQGVISQAHRHSAVIRGPSAREIRETYQIRAELEALASELAAQWISDDQLAELARIHDKFVRAVRDLRAVRTASRRNDRSQRKASDAWIDANKAFHALILQASNNGRLGQVVDQLYVGFTRNVMAASSRGMDLHRMQQNIKDHEQIIAALTRRDPQAARAAMHRHVLESGRFVIAWMENQSAAGG